MTCVTTAADISASERLSELQIQSLTTRLPSWSAEQMARPVAAICFALAAGLLMVELMLLPWATSLARQTTAVARSEPAAVELPREWRWERSAVQFDHMFRSR